MAAVAAMDRVDLLAWTAGGLETWLLDQDGICILAGCAGGWRRPGAT